MPLQLNVSQGSDAADAAAAIQGAAHRRQTAHDIRAGAVGITQHEYSDAAQLTHRDADLRADQHLLHPPVQIGAKLGEWQSGHGNGTQFGQIQDAVTRYLEFVNTVDVAEQLYTDAVAGTQYIVSRHRSGGHRFKSVGRRFEHLVAEWLERVRADRFLAENADRDAEKLECRFGPQALFDSLRSQAQQWNVRQARQQQYAGFIEFVIVASLNALQSRIVLQHGGFLRGKARLRVQINDQPTTAPGLRFFGGCQEFCRQWLGGLRQRRQWFSEARLLCAAAALPIELLERLQCLLALARRQLVQYLQLFSSRSERLCNRLRCCDR